MAVLSVESLSKGLLAAGIAPEAIYQRLVELTLDPDPQVSLAAINRFFSTVKDVAKLNGLITEITHVQEQTRNDRSSHISTSLRSRLGVQSFGTLASPDEDEDFDLLETTPHQSKEGEAPQGSEAPEALPEGEEAGEGSPDDLLPRARQGGDDDDERGDEA